MAKSFGGPSKFLSVNLNKEVIKISFITIVLISGISFCYYLVDEYFRQSKPFLISIFFGIYCVFLYGIIKAIKYAFLSNTWFMGANGEKIVSEELDKLPNDYTYFWGEGILGKNSDIDMVVVGPTGVYTIEVKSYTGQITFQNGRLLKNGTQIKKDILRQSVSQAFYLHNMFKEKFGVEIFITPIVVFSSSNAKLNFGLNKVNNVFVIQKSWLEKLFFSQPLYKYPCDRIVIESFLENHLKK